MIVETLPKLGDQVRRIELYRIYTDKWIKKQSGHRGARLNEEERKHFINDLATTLYSEDALSCHYSRFVNILQEHFHVDDAATIDYLQNDVRTCTFLTRDTSGNYNFRHKSFMEFFVAQALARDIYEDNSGLLSTKPLRIEIAGFLVEFLSSNPPQEILKRWLQSAPDVTLRDNVLLLMARLGINLSDASLETELAKDSEARLAAQLVQGDTRAFDELYIEFRKPLLDYAMEQIKDHGLAEDIVVDVFLNVFQRPDQLEQVSNIKAYLSRMVQTKILDVQRQRRRFDYVPLDEVDKSLSIETPNIESTFETQEIERIREQLLTDALENLSQTDRRILLSQGLGNRQRLAEELSITEISLRYRKMRVTEFVRTYLRRAQRVRER